MVRSTCREWREEQGAPHPRGDGPYSIARVQRVFRCSPPAWGWSARAGARADGGGVLPTRVGMVRCGSGSGGGNGCAPHPRGDGPVSRHAKQGPRACSPPAWGWSAIPQGRTPMRQVLPTRVGMVRLAPACNRDQYRAPHPRGDGPLAASMRRDHSTCSPPAWGWSGETEAETPHSPVLPTRVGMVRLPLGSVGECRGAPHPRGDGPIVPAAICLSISCSPPAWGWSVTEAPTPSSRFVLPTRVGMVRPSPHYTPG